MKYQETGRFGRITKNLRKQGFESQMGEILYDSLEFKNLRKVEQTKYVEKVMDRMDDIIGQQNAEQVLFECGAQCCGKSWSNFARRIWKNSESMDDFIVNLNKEEEKYNTYFHYNAEKNLITINRSKCICGLINKGGHFSSNQSFCKCSIGHMSVFFNSVFLVNDIQFKKSIFNGDKNCEWIVELGDKY